MSRDIVWGRRGSLPSDMAIYNLYHAGETYIEGHTGGVMVEC